MTATAGFVRQPTEVRSLNGGTQRRYLFPNGYGASVVCHEWSYGGSRGLWELAVTDDAGRLVYDTPVTNDVIGYLTESDVETHLDAIEALPARVTA